MNMLDIARVMSFSESEALQIGRRIILPSSFTNSLRYLQECYQDAMSLVRKFGKPDIFNTMTCSPQDESILAAIKPNQSPNDRPDIISRVFNKLKDQLIHEYVKEEIMGRVICYIFVIEFQKRGPPHMHALFTLDREDKLRNGLDVDRLISAEIPDFEEDPILYNLVTKFHVHGPCGDLNPKSLCMVNDICSKKYPKQFNDTTIIDTNGYAIYKRPNNNRFVMKNGQQLDNRWIVPYNPYLLKRFHCHNNVEKVSDFEGVKYLYKYIYKGHDATTIVSKMLKKMKTIKLLPMMKSKHSLIVDTLVHLKHVGDYLNLICKEKVILYKDYQFI
uniref:Helitron_like_N domain-containing protein n=1 Tax=Rhabditophanes sp. KR3021 TaxID=114890 RepID=A0AC35TYB3_9BILA